MTIQQKCNDLNRKIHEKLFLNNFLLNKTGNHERAFTSLDLIEDCQNAIEEFDKVETVKHRSTLYIYGVLQAMYCQQDGLFHLYKTIVDIKIKNVYELFKLNHFTEEIREVRDDIAGHPADRKKGKEFYFIAKGSNTKYKFSYAGYTPEFRIVEVDLKDFIVKQNDFTKTILMQIENSICEKIEIHKKKFKGMTLANLLNDLDSNIQFVYRGIYDNHHMADFGLNEMEKTIAKVKQELNTRYNNRIPESVECIFRLQDYIINKVEKWISNNEIYKNIEAEIYMDSFDKQLEELRTILTEIDQEFGN
jgi:hypothetical protein